MYPCPPSRVLFVILCLSFLVLSSRLEDFHSLFCHSVWRSATQKIKPVITAAYLHLSPLFLPKSDTDETCKMVARYCQTAWPQTQIEFRDCTLLASQSRAVSRWRHCDERGENSHASDTQRGNISQTPCRSPRDLQMLCQSSGIFMVARYLCTNLRDSRQMWNVSELQTSVQRAPHTVQSPWEALAKGQNGPVWVGKQDLPARLLLLAIHGGGWAQGHIIWSYCSCCEGGFCSSWISRDCCIQQWATVFFRDIQNICKRNHMTRAALATHKLIARLNVQCRQSSIWAL